ncbi:MAG: GHMP kinase [Nitrosopumilales archaeon]|nr:GHMP kinase [Nitrosopumilales archaeon]
MRGIAFCPAHITGFFEADLESQSLESKGSLGAGFSIQDGVTTRVDVRRSERKDFQLKVSGYKPDNTLVSEFIVKKFLDLIDENYFVDVHHDISVPVGYGLGCSAAVALSLSLALNEALGTQLSKTQIGQIAHNAEISCKTGLGDVLAAFHGGFEIRTKSGAPGIGLVEKIDTEYNSVIMICFAPISTPEFLRDRLSSINGLGGKMVHKLLQSRDTNEFQDMSLEFAKYIKVVTPKMQLVIDELSENGIKCGVALFGETIFVLSTSKLENKVFDILKKYDGIIIKSKIDSFGARLAQ